MCCVQVLFHGAGTRAGMPFLVTEYMVRSATKYRCAACVWHRYNV